MSERDGTAARLRTHPELGVLWALMRQLELVPDALAAVHADAEPTALVEQARSLVRVTRVLASQLEAYEGLLAVDAGPKARRRQR